jgi:hypothetical protein
MLFSAFKLSRHQFLLFIVLGAISGGCGDDDGKKVNPPSDAGVVRPDSSTDGSVGQARTWYLQQRLISEDGTKFWARDCELDPNSGLPKSTPACLFGGAQSWNSASFATGQAPSPLAIGAGAGYTWSAAGGVQHLQQRLVAMDGSVFWSRDCELSEDTGLPTAGCLLTKNDWNASAFQAGDAPNPLRFRSVWFYTWTTPTGQKRLQQRLISEDGAKFWARDCELDSGDGLPKTNPPCLFGTGQAWNADVFRAGDAPSPLAIGSASGYTWVAPDGKQHLQQRLVAMDGSVFWSRDCELDANDGLPVSGCVFNKNSWNDDAFPAGQAPSPLRFRDVWFYTWSK